MRVVVTGGGTGGHVYPALEVCRLAQEEADLLYVGSFRGMEGKACEQRGINFVGLDAHPVYSPTSVAGVRALLQLYKASFEAKRQLRLFRPDVVFSTGGYSSAPVMRAAQALGIPIAIHVCDTIPGRSLRLFARGAASITSTFRATETALPMCKVVRTGHPIRDELRLALKARNPHSDFVVVLGGSGGAKFLNEIVPKAAQLLPGVKFLHSAGESQYESFRASVKSLDGYTMKPYLDSAELSEALRGAKVVIARSGAGISEYAMARIPSILVPLPSSADDHQFHNAKEFESFGGASILTQDVRADEKQATADSLAAEIREWLSDETGHAERGLAEWDVADATNRIWNEVKRVAKK